MRISYRSNWVRTCPIALVLGLTAAVGGCGVDGGPGVQPQRLTAAATHPRKRTKVAHLIKARTVAPGSAVRQFCDQRHIRFQAGALAEKPGELAHNNELCKQVYDNAAAEAASGVTTGSVPDKAQ